MINIRTENFLRNMKINLIFYILVIITSFIARSIFIKILGSDITGLNSLYISLIGLLNVAELGVATAVGYSLYKPLSENNFKKINEIMLLFKYYYRNIAKIVLLLGVIISVVLPVLIKGEIDIKLAYIYYFIYLINATISYLFTYKQTLIIADQKQFKISYILNLMKIFKMILQSIVIYYFRSFLIWLIVEFLINLLSMQLANKRIDIEYRNILFIDDKKSINDIKKENIEIGKNIKNVFFHKIAAFVIYQTDSILITAFTTLKDTAIYANYMMIINALTGLLNTAIGSIMPGIGNLIAKESKEKVYDTFKVLFLFDNIIAIFITTITFHIINEFIIFWVGSEYLFSKYIVLVLIINLYIQIARGSVDRFKDGFGIYWDVFAPITESIINLFFSIILTIKFGITGVFLGTIISNVIIVVIWKPYIVFKEGFKINIINHLKQSFNIYIRNIIIAVTSSWFYYNIIINLDVSNIFFNLLIHFLILSLFCFALIVLVFFNVKEFKKILLLIKNNFLGVLKKISIN